LSNTILKKENITVITGTYNDAQGTEKNRYRTIGELVTMQGQDGSVFQFGEIWGPHGSTKFNVYAQEDKKQVAPPQQQPQQSAPQEGYYQPPAYPQR
jgi:hypothetical protein